VRSGILDKDGRDTGIDPFMASFPHLLDVGIMGHCAHGLSGKCTLAGIQCYQSGGSLDRQNMSFADFKTIADQCEGKVHQFALGAAVILICTRISRKSLPIPGVKALSRI